MQPDVYLLSHSVPIQLAKVAILGISGVPLYLPHPPNLNITFDNFQCFPSVVSNYLDVVISDNLERIKIRILRTFKLIHQIC